MIAWYNTDDGRSQPEGDAGFDPKDIPLNILLSFEVKDSHGHTSQLIKGLTHQHP